MGRLLDPETSAARSLYLNSMRWIRSRLDGTKLLSRWTGYAGTHPGSPLAHMRTLVAVHNADDLVELDLPWWTYQAIAAVDSHLSNRPRARVFEFGSGASTLWLARRAVSVDSVEHHHGWAERTRDLASHHLNGNVQPVIHTPWVPKVADPSVSSSSPSARGLDFAEYVATIQQVGGVFDFIAVDGRAREACLLAALDHCADDGLILLDDAERPRYQRAVARARELGWSVQMTKGLTPCQPLPRQTALLSRSASPE